jgi:hypothetical protein
MDKKQNQPKPIAIDKQKYVALAQEIQKIVAKEQTAQHAN